MLFKVRNLALCLAVIVGLAARGSASSTLKISIGGQETQPSGAWDTGSFTISFTDTNGHVYSETASYGQYSTPESIASTFGGKFSNDYFSSAGLCAHASGSVITFHLKGSAELGPPSITGSWQSFSVTPDIAIASILPDPAAVGSTVTIYGGPFGTSQGSSSVRFYKPVQVCPPLNPNCRWVAGTPSSWTNDTIAVQVPSGATTGDVVVVVNGQTSDGYLFMIPAACQ